MHRRSIITDAVKTTFGTLLLFFCISTTNAFDSLTPAQTQIYDYPHLSNTGEDLTIEYEYSGTSTEDITDTVRLNIGKANAERRDVDIEFLSAERRLPLPAFPDYRGNPVIIVMLEHIAQSFGKISGGGALYFRNKIRNALAEEDLAVTDGKQQIAGQSIETRTISLKPFQDDPNLATTPHLQDAELTITLSDDVLAGVFQIGIESSQQEGVPPFKRSITFKSQPAE